MRTKSSLSMPVWVWVCIIPWSIIGNLGEWRVIVYVNSNGISWTWTAFRCQMFMLQNNEHGCQWHRTCHGEPGESSGVVHTSLRVYDLRQMPLWHQRHRRVFRALFMGRGSQGYISQSYGGTSSWRDGGERRELRRCSCWTEENITSWCFSEEIVVSYLL